MNTIVLDTNILIDNIHGFAPWVNKLLRSGNNFRLVIPTIVIAEYLTDKKVETELGRKRSEEYLAWFIKQDLTEGIAQVLGTILRRKTYSPSAGTADLIIAATTIYLNAELATSNKADFAKIPHLKLFDPKKLHSK